MIDCLSMQATGGEMRGEQQAGDQQVSGAAQVSRLRQVEQSKVPLQIGQAVT